MPVNIITDVRCAEYAAPGHPERPARILKSLEFLRAQTEVKLVWAKPADADEAVILRAHDPALLARVKNPAGDFDADTPAHKDLLIHARRSVGAALAAMELARKGESAFSLMRPPGHHAMRNRAMGFCYFSNVAIAVLAARAAGVKRVAVYDFDVHHGNGTEDILLDQPGTAFFSIHQSPCFPGTGLRHRGENCFNYSLPPNTPRETYRKFLAQALAGVAHFKPDLLVVSAGFDAYARDPLAQETLEAEDFQWLGQQILALKTPACHLLEGGYSDDLPKLILSYLKGLS
jgi:acetoin utilization deacetylase AcuC-like enzyme